MDTYHAAWSAWVLRTRGSLREGIFEHSPEYTAYVKYAKEQRDDTTAPQV